MKWDRRKKVVQVKAIDFIYHILVTNVARSNRGVRRVLIHRKRRYAGVTTGDGVISPPPSQIQTMRSRPSGSEVL